MANETAKGTSKPHKKIRWVRSLFYWALAAFIILQFFQPDKNNSDMAMGADISKVVHVPDDVMGILQTSCYDCHSNHTNYPWYTNIQPVGWWLQDHIEDGKRHLNFQTFADLKPREGGRFTTVAAMQDHKLEEIADMVKEGEMPLKSYTLIHRDAVLSDAQAKRLLEWVDSARTELKQKADLAKGQ